MSTYSHMFKGLSFTFLLSTLALLASSAHGQVPAGVWYNSNVRWGTGSYNFGVVETREVVDSNGDTIVVDVNLDVTIDPSYYQVTFLRSWSYNDPNNGTIDESETTSGLYEPSDQTFSQWDNFDPGIEEAFGYIRFGPPGVRVSGVVFQFEGSSAGADAYSAPGRRILINSSNELFENNVKIASYSGGRFYQGNTRSSVILPTQSNGALFNYNLSPLRPPVVMVGGVAWSYDATSAIPGTYFGPGFGNNLTITGNGSVSFSSSTIGSRTGSFAYGNFYIPDVYAWSANSSLSPWVPPTSVPSANGNLIVDGSLDVFGDTFNFGPSVTGNRPAFAWWYNDLPDAEGNVAHRLRSYTATRDYEWSWEAPQVNGGYSGVPLMSLRSSSPAFGAPALELSVPLIVQGTDIRQALSTMNVFSTSPSAEGAVAHLGNDVSIQNVVGNQAMLGLNTFYRNDGSGWSYLHDGYAQAIRLNSDSGQGGISFHVSPWGAANDGLTSWDSSDIKMRITADGTVSVGNNASIAANGIVRAGTLELRPYALNNAWIGENVYRRENWIDADGNGEFDPEIDIPAGFYRREAGGAGLFYFQGDEGQFRFSSHNDAETLVSELPNLKITADGSFGVGPEMSNENGNFTGASFRIDGATGNVGIGTTAPNANLHVVGTAEITGALTVGGQPVLTSASSVLFLPVNPQRLAVGSGALATGANAFASGSGAQAQGDNSVALGGAIAIRGIAIGLNANSSGFGAGSISIGAGSNSTGLGAIAVGGSAQATAQAGLALGHLSKALFSYSTAIGPFSEAQASFATSIGSNTRAGAHAIALGSGASATGVGAAAIGYNANASGFSSIALGLLADARGYQQAVIGAYNAPLGDPNATTPNLSDTIFIVGNGSDDANRSNALTIRKDAGAAIGVGVTSNAAAQVVLGRYNDTSPGTAAANTFLRTEGVLVVGAGVNNTGSIIPRNALRVTDDGTVLVQAKGDLSMGDFADGPQP